MFQRPEYFFVLFALVPLGAVLWTGFLRGRRDLKVLVGRRRDYLDIFSIKWFFSSLALLLFVVLFTMTLADPERRGAPEIRTVENRDTVFALDISRSMLAEDSEPNRLGRSVEIIRGVISSHGGTGRFGLTVFRGTGLKLIPITEDRALFDTVLASLQPAIMTRQGSDLPSGLESALESFPSGVEGDRFLFLFTDGENFGRELAGVAKSARELGIRVIAIGAGEVAGARIPTGDGGYLRDADGETVVTRLHPANLRFLAEETEGEYLSLNDPGLMRKIDSIYGTSSIRYNEPRESAYHLYLLGALISLLLYFLIRIVRWKNAF